MGAGFSVWLPRFERLVSFMLIVGRVPALVPALVPLVPGTTFCKSLAINVVPGVPGVPGQNVKEP